MGRFGSKSFRAKIEFCARFQGDRFFLQVPLIGILIVIATVDCRCKWIKFGETLLSKLGLEMGCKSWTPFGIRIATTTIVDETTMGCDSFRDVFLLPMYSVAFFV